jgi:hypothetical protein
MTQRVLDIAGPAGFVKHLPYLAAPGEGESLVEVWEAVAGCPDLSEASTLSAGVLLVLAATPTDSREATSPVRWT